MSQPWDYFDDCFLIFYARSLNQAFGSPRGYAAVAPHLERPADQCIARAAFLLAEFPEFVAEMESASDLDEVGETPTPATFNCNRKDMP